MGRDVRVCALVKRGAAFIEHELVLYEGSDTNHVLIEVVPSSGRKKTGLFVLNVYSSPLQRNRTHTFDALFREAMSKAASNPLLICGDFNAPHTQWASHTRIGQGVCRDTPPDLSVWSGADVVTWSSSFEDLESDHRILCVPFRENREQDKKEGPIEDISEWCRELLADVEKATDEIEWMDWRQQSPKEGGDRSPP
ncbi:hypothetical protein HPB49_010356 [Dermacentor silvarum]|uniref:Uncharacterized protein n=1 Tax=Dermacentor silvarum TaxID=543639 RepID=A0ACB8DCP7_DERSI|nr:hypothetical protein HPB49_010356 [Dermacentor silvarum]